MKNTLAYWRFKLCLGLTALGIRVLTWIAPGDRAVLEFVRRFVFRGKPRAARHLAHYLGGSGRAVEISVAELLAGDEQVRGLLFDRILAQLGLARDQGQVPVSQWMFADGDWRCALGSLRVSWRREGNAVQAWFVDRYRWHAEEPRPTRSLHRAADRLQESGAREFNLIGRPARFALEHLRAQARRVWVPGYRRIYM